MKKILAIFFICAFVAACSKQNATPTEPIDEMVDTTSSNLSFSGAFMNGPYGTVTGTANIYKDSSGSYVLALEDFQTSNGPDLHVYMSQEELPVHFIDLGKLRSTNGNQLYAIPERADLELYKYALIHCQQYNHLFGSSFLEEQ